MERIELAKITLDAQGIHVEFAKGHPIGADNEKAYKLRVALMDELSERTYQAMKEAELL